MKGFDEYDKYIDGFYGEVEEGMMPSSESFEFSEKLEKASSKLHVLDEDIYEFDIDTMGIIEMAEEIKDARKSKFELGLFIVSGLSILSLYGFLGLRFGYKLILTSQIIFMSIIPWLIVPIAIKRKRGSEI